MLTYQRISTDEVEFQEYLLKKRQEEAAQKVVTNQMIINYAVSRQVKVKGKKRIEVVYDQIEVGALQWDENNQEIYEAVKETVATKHPNHTIAGFTYRSQEELKKYLSS